jgi:hypothetical protein
VNRSILFAFALPVALTCLSSCTSVSRTEQTSDALLSRRAGHDEQYFSTARDRYTVFLKRVKVELDEYQAGVRSRPPVIDYLVISGGGDWGAFGAGVLHGWGDIPDSSELARPQFDIVTGVSTGALIAPFAFVGTDESLASVDNLYRNPKPDWVRNRGFLFFLPSNVSFAEIPGLERELRASVSLDLTRDIVERGRDGSMLAVNTTNLDDASPQVFFLDDEAKRAVDTGDLSRLHNILLASAGIPGAFPYREVDGCMFVDGGVTANIIYGARIKQEDSLAGLWSQMYPGLPMPTIRYWIIFNNKLRALPSVVPARWPAIVQRSFEVSIREATLTSMRHLHALAEIARLKYNANIEIRLIAIPDQWQPPEPGQFNPRSMNDLADLGRRMGADPGAWSSEIPRF